MNELEKYLYDNMYLLIQEGFLDNEKSEIEASYQNYLIENYHEDMEEGINLDKAKQIFLKLEKSKWEGKNKEEKQILLLKDEYLEKLGYLSNLALKYATARLNGKMQVINITKEQAEEYIKLMEENALLVRPFNKKIANIYLSEGINDFMYALGLSDTKSFRIGRIS